MGKRKSSKPEPKRKRYVLPTEFDCPSCNYSKCIEVRMYRKKMEGEIKCRICAITYKSGISPIMEPADLYCVWVDECEQLNQKKQKKAFQRYPIPEDDKDSLLDDSEEKFEIPRHQKKAKKKYLRKRSSPDSDDENRFNKPDLASKKSKASSIKRRDPKPVASKEMAVDINNSSQKSSDSADNFSELKSLRRDNKSINKYLSTKQAPEFAKKSAKNPSDQLEKSDDSLSRKEASDDRSQEKMSNPGPVMFGGNKRRKKRVISDSESDDDEDINQSELEKEL